MKINTQRFSVLLEVLERAAVQDEYGYPATDILEATYVQGATPAQDRLENLATVANEQDVSEHGPCYTSLAQPAYLRKGRLVVNGDELPLRGVINRAQFSADGQRLAYLCDWGQVWLARPDGSDPRLVAEADAGTINGLEFGTDGHLWYAHDVDGLMRYDPSTGAHTPVPTQQPIEDFAVSHDGGTLAYMDWATGSLRSQDLATGRERILAESDYWQASPVFTPDDSRVLFVVGTEADPARSGLYVVASRGRPVRHLVEGSLDIHALRPVSQSLSPLALARAD